MMKCEFEQMIGKEVSAETFAMYNKMYMATDLSKQDFVKLLNIKAIPESAEAIERREKANLFKQEILNKIQNLKDKIKNCEFYAQFDPMGDRYWKQEIRIAKNEIKTLKAIMA